MAESDSIEYRGVNVTSPTILALARRVQQQIEAGGQQACESRDKFYAELEKEADHE